MSSVPASPRRHALGLPAGSVRAMHVIMVVLLLCASMLVPTRTPQPIPPYLIYLAFIVLGHFFAAHGVTIGGDKHPLYLPPGLVRFLIVVALGGTIGYKLFTDEAGLYQQFELSLDEMKLQPFLPLAVLGGFLLGVIVRAILGREHQADAIKDLEAWVSILALVGLGVAAIMHLVVAPNLEKTLSLPTWEMILAGVVAFYFGERS